MITLGVRYLVTLDQVLTVRTRASEDGSSTWNRFVHAKWQLAGIVPSRYQAEDAAVLLDGCGYPGFASAHNVASESAVDRAIEQAVSPERLSLSDRKKYFGEVTPATSKIQMVSRGRPPIIQVFG